MIVRATIHRVCMTKKTISLNLSSPDIDTNTIEEVKKIKKQSRPFNVEMGGYSQLSFEGMVVSMNVRDRFHFVLHLDKEQYWQTILKFSKIIDKFVNLRFTSEK